MDAASPEAIIKHILQQRDISDVNRFLDPQYERDSHDPYLLPDMEPAIKRLVKAKADKEKVIVYGDYDIDGLCASAILLDAFKSFGIDAEVFIPDRFVDGYGLNGRALEKLRRAGAGLIVTVDCGSTSTEEIAAANKRGLDIIVTDHHEPPPTLPQAVAVVNPKRPDSEYPWHDLAGNGVAFKLVQALQEKLDGLPAGQEKWLLDLVALGTVCDVVALRDENRMLVSKGLTVLTRTRRPGLRALAKVAGVELSAVTTETLGFIFGPRLNAAGRLTHAANALKLLTTQDKNEAWELAQELNRQNTERRSQQAAIEEEAVQQAKELSSDPVLVLHGEQWSHGIVGIVAARLMERFAKPVFIMQRSKTIAKGSARSFGGFSAVEALNSARDLLASGGGHKAAAGFSLKPAHIEAFRRRLNEHYASLGLMQQGNQLVVQPDVSITTFSAMNLDLWNRLQALQPFGHGNAEPRFHLKNVRLADWRRVGADKTHIKLDMQDEQGARLDAIAFRQVQDPPGETVNITARLDRNEYRGLAKPQAIVDTIEAIT